jgi:hypothetical protein
LHLKNIYAEGELERGATVKENLTVQKEGKREVTRRIESKVQRKFAEEHALNELAKYRELEHRKDLSTAVQQHFEEAMKRLTEKRKNLDDLDAPSEE